MAPAAAGVCLAAAALARLAGWSAIVPAGLLAAGAAALAVFAVASRRARPVSDAAAAAIDADAGMAGELRSAAWFAARDRRDDWADFHIERAASRLRAIDWRHLYPPVQARGARLSTAAMVLGALALAATMPARVATRQAPAAPRGDRTARGEPAGEILRLSPELEQQLAALLAAAESGNPAAAEALARNAELREMLNQLSQSRDPQVLEALARALAANALAGQGSPAEEMKTLADRARKAAESASISRDMQEALEKLADELDTANEEAVRNSDEANASAGGPKPGEAGQSGADGGMQDLSIQFAKDADPAGGSGVLMMSSQDGDQAGPPGAGVGGSGSPEAGAAAAMAGIEAALKEELVEASADNAGANVETEIRRKTEHGNAAVGFTRSAPGAFDRARVATPPPVPEARRSDVQSYFVRPPQ
jgi:hypothetical protein